MSEQRKFPTRTKNALDNRKLNMSAPSPSGKGRANLIWGVHVNGQGTNPNLTVYTGVDGDKENGRIQARLDAPTFFALISALKHAVKADTPNDWKIKLENKNYTFFGGKRSDAPEVTSHVWVGKDKNGVVWISVLATDNSRPKIQFKFGASDWHRFIDANGEPLSDAAQSALYAEGYINLLSLMTAHLLTTLWVEPKKKDNNGGGNRGGGGGYNRGSGGGSGGGGGGSDSEDDDLPF